MDINYIKPQAVATLAILVLCACTSPPRQVQASIPLVAPKSFNGQAINQQYWQLLESNATNNIDHEGQQIQVGEKYTSALGLSCRKLTVLKDKLRPSERIACSQMIIDDQGQSKTQWFLTKQIVHSATAVEIN